MSLPSQKVNADYLTCGDEAPSAGRGPGQLGWYRFASQFGRGKSVLDVGCGLGSGLQILSESASSARGIDLDERLAAPNVDIMPISDCMTKSVDVVICIDVIEHVEEDVAFCQQLARVARELIVVTTPNWTASRCAWPYHVREYTPVQFFELLGPLGELEIHKGSPSGDEAWRVNHPNWWMAHNRLRANRLTSFPARVINNLVPHSWRICSHLCGVVRLG